MPDLFRRTARLAGWASLLALAAGGCDRSPAGPGVLASISVNRHPDTLVVATTRQFTAIGVDAEGTPVGIKPTWSVAASGGTVDAAGVFTAGHTPGTFANTVTATVGSLSGAATVTVLAGGPASLAVQPGAPSLVAGATQQFTAVVKDAFGNVITVAPHWSVAAGGGSITAAGLFTAGNVAGTYPNAVVASVGSVTAAATVTVTAGTLASIVVMPASTTLSTGGTQQFTAAGTDGNGNPVSIAPVWSVASGGGTISASGVFTAGTVAGSFPNTVTASVGAVAGHASVTVSAGGAASIVLTPASQSLVVGGTQQFTAVVKDLVGNVLPVTPTWSVAAGGGTINATGLFTAGTLAGSFLNTVRAAVGAVTAFATITVTPGPLAAIVLTPNAVNPAVNGTQQFAAVGRDATGNAVVITPNWSVVAGGGTISSAGLFTAGVVAGTFSNTVRVCSTAPCAAGSVAAFASVTVSPGPLATLTITPNLVAIGTGAVQAFTTVGRDLGGNVVAGPLAPVWSVLPGHAGGTIGAASGVYIAPAAAGFDSVQAAIGAISAAARVNVSLSGALVSLVITPNPATVIAGGTSQFTASGFDATGLIVPTPGLLWSIVPTVGGGAINAGTGLFTAGIVTGTFTNAVKAVSGTVLGFASVTVAAPPSAPALGAVATYGVLAGTAVSCGTSGTIGGDAGVWPGNTVTGVPPCVVAGSVHAGDPFAQAAQFDLATAFQALAAMPCNVTITGNLGGTTLAEGVSCSASSIAVTGTVTLSGTASSVFVIRAASTLAIAGNVVLSGGAQAKNVFWWVGSTATLAAGSTWQGNLLALTSITLANTATVTGRVLARNGAVSLGNTNVITLP